MVAGEPRSLLHSPLAWLRNRRPGPPVRAGLRVQSCCIAYASGPEAAARRPLRYALPLQLDGPRGHLHHRFLLIRAATLVWRHGWHVSLLFWNHTDLHGPNSYVCSVCVVPLLWLWCTRLTLFHVQHSRSTCISRKLHPLSLLRSPLVLFSRQLSRYLVRRCIARWASRGHRRCWPASR